MRMGSRGHRARSSSRGRGALSFGSSMQSLFLVLKGRWALTRGKRNSVETTLFNFFLWGIQKWVTTAFTLTNRGKASFFYYHRRFLPHNHRYRKNRKDFFVGRVEKDVAPPRLSGEELHDVVSEYGDIVFGLQSGKQKFPGFGLTHNWVKQSIFW